MIEFKSYYSGSSGNLYSISDGKTDLMIECGVRWKLIQKAFNFKTSKISGCLLSHEDRDHSHAVKEVAKAGIDIHLSKGTMKALKVSGHRYHSIKANRQFSIGTWEIKPFKAIHDAIEPLGFYMGSGEDRALFLVDSCYVHERFRNLSLIAIGVNYDKEILKDNIIKGKIDPALGKRIIRNHLSLSTAIGFFKANDLSKLEQIHILHLSDTNSNAEMFKREVSKITGRPTYIGE